VPLALTCFSPILTLCGIYWVPESPRYLAWVDRKQECLKVLQKLHYDRNDPDNESAAIAEYQQVVLQVEHDKLQKVNYWKMFFGPASWRRRSLLAFFLLFATQCTGVLGIGNFQVLIYESLGLSGYMPLLFYCIYALIGTIPNFISAICMDKVGRRRMLLIGYPAVTFWLIIEMVLQKYYIGTTNKGGNAAAVAALWIWIGCYGFFIDPPQFVYVSEIFPTTLRAKGIVSRNRNTHLECHDVKLTESKGSRLLRLLHWRHHIHHTGTSRDEEY